jgi:SIR2-like domain
MVQLVPNIYWYRIYTTNIDNVVERIYGFDRVDTKLEVVDGRRADYKDHDQFLETIQLIKLNGVDLGDPDSLTFSFLQYARRASENPTWYDHFVRDYSTHPVTFLGSKLDEPLFWQALEARGKRFGGKERRSKAFVVSPSFSMVVRQKFDGLGLIPIEGTAQEFLEAIAVPENLLSRDQIISQLHPEVAHQLAAAGEVSNAERAHVQQFLSGFHIVRQPERMPRVEKEFLLGARPDWADIYANFDAHRDCEDVLLSLIQERLSGTAPRAILVSGSAGSGKSTVMMRVALQLANAGTQVLFADPFYSVAAHHIAPALATFSEPLAVFVDDARTLLSTLSALIEAVRISQRRVVVIAGERGNRSGRVMQRLAALQDPEEFDMPNLSDRDIDALIDKLSEFNLLGKLAGKTRAQQRYEFSIRAEKQILVAMREATQGEPFDHIIESELESIELNEAKIAYLAICLATTFGNHLTIDQFLSLVDVFPNEALDLLDTQLKGIVLRREPQRRAVQARHRIIAEALLDSLAPRALVKQAYIRLLQTLAHDLDFTQPNRSKVFRLYRDVINHRLIEQRFRTDIASARAIFQSLEGYLKHDYHFLLQYASLELEYDELATAENYLAQAEELAPRRDDFIQTTKAMLFYKQAAASHKLHEAAVMRDEARKILLEQIEERPDDPYPAHVLCARELDWIEQWPSRFEERRRLLGSLRDEAEKLFKRYPYSRKLENLKKRIEERYLQLAAPRVKEEGGTA